MYFKRFLVFIVLISNVFYFAPVRANPSCNIVLSNLLQGPLFEDLRANPESSPLIEIKDLIEKKAIQEASWIADRKDQERLSDTLLRFVKNTLKRGKIISKKRLGGGITETYLVTFENAQKAVWKPDPESWSESFQEESWAANYNAEVASYDISEVLELKLVPITVERTIDDVKGSLQIFIRKDRKKYSDLSYNSMKIFDWLINNRDRHGGNFLRFHGQVVPIDHGLSFQPARNPKGINPPLQLTELPIDQSQIDFYKNLSFNLTETVINKIMAGKFSEKSINEFLMRRKRLLQRFQKLLGPIESLLDEAS